MDERNDSVWLVTAARQGRVAPSTMVAHTAVAVTFWWN